MLFLFVALTFFWIFTEACNVGLFGCAYPNSVGPRPFLALSPGFRNYSNSPTCSLDIPNLPFMSIFKLDAVILPPYLQS